MEKIEQVFGHNLLRICKALDLSQPKMAEKLKVPERTYQRWEQGKAIPRIEQRSALRELGIKETELFLDPDLTEPSDDQIIARIQQKFGEKSKLSTLPSADSFASLDEEDRRTVLDFIRRLKAQKLTRARKGNVSGGDSV